MLPAQRALRCFLAALTLGCGLCGLAPSARAQDSGTNVEGPITPRLATRASQLPDASQRHAIDNDTVLRMSKAGLEDALILQTIQTNPAAFSVAPDDLIALKSAGVSQKVIAAMQAKSAGLAVRNAAPVDVAPLAAGVDEIGVYYKDKDGMWVPLRTERVEFRSGGWLKSAATHNIVKEDSNGLLDGPRSPLQVRTGVEILIYTPVGTQAEEYDLIRFREKKDRREFRVTTGGVFHSETGSARDEIEFHPVKIAKDMYTFKIPADIEKGEYGVLPPGAANQRGLSSAGKMFTFSIRE